MNTFLEIQSLKQPEGPRQPYESILRRVGRHHFAFLKGYLEGLDLRELAVRYLESADEYEIDLREVKSTLRWIQDELVIVARRRGKFGFARLIGIGPENFSAGDPIPEDLEVFRTCKDPDNFYTEAELIELFEQEFRGQIDRKFQRNARLREKQKIALAWLEEIVASDPQLNDHVHGWFAEGVAHRLSAANIFCIRDLVAVINGRGQRWYTKIPKIGEKAAGRILKWLQMNKETLEIELGIQVFTKRRDLNPSTLALARSKAEAIVPLEYFQPSERMNGSDGLNRGTRNRTAANNDYDAIQLWLSTCTSEQTRRSYRKEAERFLLWSIFERNKPMSSMLVEDCIAYRNFLADLGSLPEEKWNASYKLPQESWLGKRGTPRWSPLWRPFENPSCHTKMAAAFPETGANTIFSGTKHPIKTSALSEASQKQAVVILKSMCEWLTRQRYLDSNPWDAVPARQRVSAKINKDRSFTVSQWIWIMKYLDAMPRDPKYYRLRFVLNFAYGTGLRLSELTGALISDLKRVQTSGARQSAWVLKVLGKGRKEREVVVPSPILTELEQYLIHRGYRSLQEVPRDAPLIDRLVGLSSPSSPQSTQFNQSLAEVKLSDQALYKALKAFFLKVASELQKEAPDDAEHIANASTHWLRHTCGSHAIANGVPIEVIQANFGHASIDTTTIYITAEMDRRISAMENFIAQVQTQYAPANFSSQ